MDKNMTYKIVENASRYPDKVAFFTPLGSLTYSELLVHTRKAAAFLTEKQICPGDRIMVQTNASPYYIASYFAIHYIGAIAVPVDRNATLDTVLIMKKELSISLFLSESEDFWEMDFAYSSKDAYEFSDELKSPAYHPSEDEEISDILFTTGTTGKSKGVIISHKAVLGGISNVINGTGISSEDTLLIPVPLNHSFGLRELRTILYIGGTAVLQNGFAFAKALQNNIQKYNCTCMTCVPAAIRVLYQQSKGQLKAILGDLRYIEFCTAPLDLEMKQILLEQFPNTCLLNSYGSTESAGAVYLNFSSNPEKLLSIGRPVEGVQAKIVDDANQIIEKSTPENSGRLAISGNMNMNGYWNSPEVTSSVLIDGWVFTNDIAYIDEDGFIFLLGRANDVINVGGKKVSPVEIENAAIMFPGIRECCCVSVEDPRKILGHVPVLFVVSDTAINKTELKEYLVNKLEPYKIPADIIQIKEIPKNYMGKTDRNALKKLIEH